MKRIILLGLFLLLGSGCAVATITTSSDFESTECSGYYASVFKDIDAASMSACGAKGKSTGSTVNNELAQELFKALIVAP